MSLKVITQILPAVLQTNKKFWSAVFFVFAATVTSYLVMAAAYPELLLFHKMSFMWKHDPEIPFENTYTLISHYFHGGIQLWNRYDQMTYAFSHLTVGLYTLVNILLAGIYILLSPLFSYPGEAYHTFYSIGFHFLTIGIRTIGGYLLLRHFRLHPVIVFISLIYFNTLLSSTMYFGVLINNLYSYLPLLLYFILRFLRDFRLNDFLGGIVVMTLAIANSPLLAMSYFYPVIHFFIVLSLPFSFYRYISLRKKGVLPSFRSLMTRPRFLKVLCVCVVCFLMILPFLYMAKTATEDFYLTDTGLGGTEGRFHNMLSVSRYFKATNLSKADPKEFFSSVLNFNENNWQISWVFLGGSVLLLSFLGWILSKRKEKHLFAGTIILIILVNTAHDPRAITSLAHWINALTNPFSFLMRSFAMVTLFMPFLFLPLVAFGLESGKELLFKESSHIYPRRVRIGILFLVASAVFLGFYLPCPAREVNVAIALIFASFLYYVWEGNHLQGLIRKTLWERTRRPLAAGVLFAMFLLDFFALRVYVESENHSRHELRPQVYFGLLETSPVILHYQNPKILPLREYFGFFPDRPHPTLYNKQGNFGLFYQFTHLPRDFRMPGLYTPLHASYRNLYPDIPVLEYLKRNRRLMFLASLGVRSDQATLPPILSRNLEKEVVIITSERKDLPYTLGGGAIRNPKTGELPARILEFSFPFNRARPRRVKDFIEYQFDLPAGFPAYVSTNVFVEDCKGWEMTVAGQKLSPVQGKLTAPYTYDVQNIREKRMFLLLPADFKSVGKKAVLKLELSPYLTDVWKNEHDNFGFDYFAPHDGWLVFHFPYSKKWQLTIDGKPGEIFRVNKYFIGTPLEKGEHKILLRFWPNTLLRQMISLAIVLTVLMFGAVVFLGLKQETEG